MHSIVTEINGAKEEAEITQNSPEPSQDNPEKEVVDQFGIYARGKTGVLLRIPPEILLEILVLCCSSGSDLIPGLEAQLPPLILSHVSRYWRKLAFSTPQLWSHFALDIGYCRPELLSCYLEHSEAAPLDIQCSDLAGSEPPRFCAKKREVIYALLSHSRRWRSASFDLDSHREWKRAIKALLEPPSFPMLEALDLWGGAFFSKSPEQDILHRLFPKTRSIRSLSMGFAVRKSTLCIPLPLQPRRLTYSYELRDVDSLGILEQFPETEELTIDYCSLTWEFAVNATIKRHFHHKSLTTLFIRFCRGEEDEYYSEYEPCKYSLYLLFRTLTLPALTRLHVLHPQVCYCDSSHGREVPLVYPWDSEGFKGLIMRSQCSLDRLLLIDVPLKSSDIHDILITCPSLTKFIYHEFGGKDATLHLLELLANGEPGPPLPALKHLGIAVGGPSTPGTMAAEEESAIIVKVDEMSTARCGMHLNPLELSLDLRRPLLPSSREVLEGISREAISSVSVSLG
ncbi:hypothetical protein PM082_000230 [Marasmius tenuissimus]|nr:hypothetical protein PM082_000230 [Marasmius tenuissimus]